MRGARLAAVGCIALASLFASGPASPQLAAPFLAASCFNGGEGRERVVLWTFEGYSDWRSARKGSPAILVFTFHPGKPVYDVSDLPGCFYMPADTRERVYRCQSGLMRLTKVDLPKMIAGEYRLAMTNGDVKLLQFEAPYCPPWR